MTESPLTLSAVTFATQSHQPNVSTKASESFNALRDGGARAQRRSASKCRRHCSPAPTR